MNQADDIPEWGSLRSRFAFRHHGPEAGVEMWPHPVSAGCLAGWLLFAACGLLPVVIGGALVGGSPGLVLAVGFAGVVLAAVYGVLKAPPRWRFWPGKIGRRFWFPVLGWQTLALYRHPTKVEIRHGVWSSGQGSTDLLSFWCADRKRPVVLAQQHGDSVTAAVSRRASSEVREQASLRRFPAVFPDALTMSPAVAVTPPGEPDLSLEILALARCVGMWTGLPVEITQESITDPRPQEA